MIEVRTGQTSYEIFLALTGHAFSEDGVDPLRAHGFYWAMRWLSRQVLGETWLGWNAQA